MNIKHLKFALAALTLFALGAASIPFLGSLSPNSRSLEHAGESGRAVDLDDLELGTFIEKGDDYSRYFVIHDFDGQIRLFAVPYREGKYRIADLTWDRPFLPCEDFGPDADGSRLINGGAFRCRDESMSDWWRKESVWDYSGKSMGERSGDMPEGRYDIREGTLFIVDGFWPLEDISASGS